MNNNQKQNITENAKKILKEKGINAEEINGNTVNSIIQNLNKEDQNKINSLLNDKKALEALLNSDKAKAIMKMFGAK